MTIEIKYKQRVQPIESILVTTTEDKRFALVPDSSTYQVYITFFTIGKGDGVSSSLSIKEAKELREALDILIQQQQKDNLEYAYQRN